MEEAVVSLSWNGSALTILDQTLLPAEVRYLTTTDYREVAEAICTLKVRGAPAVGVAAAYGLVLGAMEVAAGGGDFRQQLEKVAQFLLSTRPTAVNLRWAIERLMSRIKTSGDPVARQVELLEEEAGAICREDVEANRRMGNYGQALLPQEARVLTHCNAGALATAGYGTALGVLRAAAQAGKKLTVYADETRPLLQGARLTAWELMKEGINTVLITDSMAGYLMKRGMVDLVLVGADRITANGDVANKIGTYTLAVLAASHALPFYVAAPFSTLDLTLETGDQIPIEERRSDEVTGMNGVKTAPDGVGVWNPAFDVTPGRLVTAIITEAGVIYPPYGRNLAALK